MGSISIYSPHNCSWNPVNEIKDHENQVFGVFFILIFNEEKNQSTITEIIESCKLDCDCPELILDLMTSEMITELRVVL